MEIEPLSRILGEAIAALILVGCAGMIALFWLPS